MKKLLSIAFVICFSLVFFVSCSNEKSVVGTWVYTDDPFGIATDIEITFNDDGTGTKPFSLIEGNENFEYTVNGDLLTLTFDSDVSLMNGTYTMLFGTETTTLPDNALSLTDENGETLIFIRVEK